ncbi:MAG: GntR family transcriptional regulator [Epulopiscium sp. Nele67-Bin005]|nr:MAG: GntR family transcriptional regulator [Epulopiscium sp. Nele67-Bin005]
MRYDTEHGERSSLRGMVFNRLREDILEDKYHVGDILRENVIAKELSVSRTPVREAIRQLELEGLVHSIPNKETVVAGVSQEDIEDILTMRLMLEGLAIKYAAERIQESELIELEEVLTLTKFYIAKKDYNQIKNLDHRFHEVLYNSSRSKILTHILLDFHSYIQKFRKSSIMREGRAVKMLEEHMAIYDAIKNGKIEEAEVASVQHINSVIHNAKLQ